MSKQKKLQQYIFKIDSDLLEKKKWDLTLPIENARKIEGLIVALADSQILSWINELNGTQDYDKRAKTIKREIKWLKKQPTSKANKMRISELYKSLYKLQFKEDYVCVVMNKKSHYKRANKGFKINGINYKRLLCTTGGVKMSTVVYVSDRVHAELKRRIENGRDINKPMVPAKYGAYESLCASGSLEVSWPRPDDAPIPGGVIVVKDCFTNFKSDVINVDDSNYPDEPIVQLMKNQDIENNCSDGCSIITPELSRRWCGELNGDFDRTCSGFNLRNAFLKGMAFTFDIVKFAEEVIGASEECPEKYLITDVWNQKRDIRDALLIVTESQLKLWDSYSSWEDYYNNCRKNNYTFRIAKTTPYYEELDEVRQLNYQFIQSLELSDNDIQELIYPTVQEIKDIMGLDVRKSIAYLCGKGLDNDTAQYADVFAKVLMIEPEMINDPFIRNKIRKMIARRIKDAKIGVLDAYYSNFQIISGDLYALAESMFGLKPVGLLKAGELYSKFWIDRNVNKVLCARAPMSNAHSLLTQSVNSSIEAQKWFDYMDSVVVINAWDTAPMALNGCDFDGDLLFTTTCEPLMKNQHNLPALRCVQRKAAKKIITENDLIQSNLQGFGSQIGQITNRCTAITSLMANFPRDSEEYKILQYRTQCFQNGQQNEIDKAKGIVTEPLPKSWWVMKENRVTDGDSEEEIAKKQLYATLCADKKPYFFAYNYSNLKTEYDTFMRNVRSNSVSLYKKDLDVMIEEYNNGELVDENEIRFMQDYHYRLPLDRSAGTMNRICWAIEKDLDGIDMFKDVAFDYSVLKSDENYDEQNYNIVKHICTSYKLNVQLAKKRAMLNCDTDEESDWQNVDIILQNLVENLHSNCSNEEELCDILADLCYRDGVSKQIFWKACGDIVVNRLLKSHNYKLSYPKKSEDGDFWCKGVRYVMTEITVEGGDKYEEI